MTEKLDEFRPNRETLLAVRRQLVSSGIDPENIPGEWVEATIAAMAKWMKTTEQGAYTVMNLLGFESIPGSINKEYTHYPDEGPREVPVLPSNISFFRGVMVNNLPVSPSQVDIRDKSEDSCEDCGIIGHCTLMVLDPYSDSLVRLCNHCVSHNDHPKVYDQGDRELCSSCPKTSCSNNPSKSAGFRRHS